MPQPDALTNVLGQMKPYQIYAKNFISTRPFSGLFFDMGLGKAIDDETWVPTPLGMRQIKSLLPGDILFDMNGEPCHIEAVFHHTNIDAYIVTLDDGRQFTCSYEHQIPIAYDKYTRDIRTVMLKDLLGQNLKSDPKTFRFGLPRIRPAEYPKKDHIINPQVLGLMISYGIFTSGGVWFKLNDFPEDDRDNIMTLVKQTAAVFNTHLVINQSPDGTLVGLQDQAKLMEELSHLGYTDKFDMIPEEYRFDWTYNRSSLMMGLFGVTRMRRNPEKHPFEMREKLLKQTFQTEHGKLADDIAEMVYAMGWLCTRKYRPRKKLHELNMLLKQRMSDRTYITKIEQTTPRNMTCFTVTGSTHTYLINDYIPTHNTLITLTSLFERNPRGHVLVIAPKNIARNTWLNEIKKWNLPIRTKSFVCDEKFKDLSRKKRLQRYEEVQTDPATVYFINRELLVDLIKHMPIINGRKIWFFPNIIIDESQSFKSYKAARFKAMQPILPCLQTAVILTGTPAPKDLMDLWSQIYILDQGQRLGRTITEYRRMFFKEVLYVNGRPVKWEPLPGAEEEIYRRIGDIVISAKNTAIKLPPLTYNDFTVYMEDDEWELYKEFAKQQVIDLDCETQITAANRGVLHNKLSQMASGTIYIDDQHNYKILHQHKVEAVKQIIENSSGSVLIAYYYNSDRDILLKEIDGAVCFDGSNRMLEDWNNKRIPVMMIHPASSGHGLNLQFGGHVLIWYTIIDNLEYYLQTNARLYRQGQTEPVIIHHIITDRTVDVPGLPALQEKDNREQRLLDAVRIAIDMTV